MPPVRAALRRLLFCAMAGSTFGTPASAAPGEHIRVGATEIVPAIGVGVEGQTNAYRANPGRHVGAFDFYLVPSLRITTRARKVWFDFDGNYELRKFFDKAVAANLDQFSNFRLGASVQILPEGVVGFNLSDRAQLVNRATDRQWRSNALITQFRNDLEGTIAIRPGPDLEIDAGFGFGYQDFRIPGLYSQVGFDNKLAYTPHLDIVWKFFPNTAFVVDATYEMNRWADNVVATNRTDVGTSVTAESGPYGKFIALPDSDLFKAQAGLRGRISRVFLVDVMVGYGFGRFDAQSVIEDAPADAGAEADPVAAGFGQNLKGTDGILVTFRPVVDLGFTAERKFGQRITVVYQKDFQTSFFTNYVHSHYVYGSLESRWGRWLKSSVGGGSRFEHYVGELNRDDVYSSVSGGLSVLPTRYLDLRFSVDWTHRDSTEKAVEFDNVLGRVMLTFVY